MINLFDIFLNDSFSLSQRIIKIGIDHGIERETSKSLEEILMKRFGNLKENKRSSLKIEGSKMWNKISQSLKIK